MKKMKDYKYHYGIKMRIYPNYIQKEIIRVSSNASRFTYNKLVELNKERYLHKKALSPVPVIKDRINEIDLLLNNKKAFMTHYNFLNNKMITTDVIDNAKANYNKAWNMFKKNKASKIPTFKKKSYQESYQVNCRYINKKEATLTNGTIRFLDKKHIFLPKIGRIRISGSHERILKLNQEIRIGTVTIKKDSADNYYVSMQLGSDSPFVKKIEKTGSKIGIDLNLRNFLYASDGTVVENPKYYRLVKNKLARKRRKLSKRMTRAKKEGRKLRDSKNYQKLRKELVVLEKKVRNKRNNFLHNTSTSLINNHDLVVAEELRSKNLLKNHKLALSISDVGWRTFLSMLDYKADLYNKTFITVDPKYTTQTCNKCNIIMGKYKDTKKLTLDKEEWICPNCKTHHIRDYNASINILNKGIKKNV